MTIAHPRTTHDPQPSTREHRALALYREHHHEIVLVDTDTYEVPSCTGSGFYLVEYGGEVESCNCPDFRRHHRPCKHLYAARVVKAKTASCEGCSKRFRHRSLVEVTEENSAFTLSAFVGERYCRSCAHNAGIL